MGLKGWWKRCTDGVVRGRGTEGTGRRECEKKGRPGPSAGEGGQEEGMLVDERGSRGGEVG